MLQHNKKYQNYKNAYLNRIDDDINTIEKLYISVIVLTSAHLMAPHVEYELEDAPEHVGREMREFRREDRHEALAMRVFVGFVASRRADFPHVLARFRVTRGLVTWPPRCVSDRSRCAGAKERSAIAMFSILNRCSQGSV